MTDRTEQPALTPTELRMLRVARTWGAEGRTSEHGRPVRESRLIDLVRRRSAIRQPVKRPKDREVRPAQPSSRKPAAEAPVRNRPAVNNMPAELPDPPAEPAGGRECEAVECFERSVGWRFYRAFGWLSTCSRHMSGAGPAIRRMDADCSATFGPGSAGATAGAVCPPVASNPQKQARGASEPQRPVEGLFWPIAAEESPAATPGHAPDGLAGPSSPSGPPRPAAGGTEPHSAAAATEAARS